MLLLTRCSLLASAASLAAASAAGERLPIRKAVEFNMLPRSLKIDERFQMANCRPATPRISPT